MNRKALLPQYAGTQQKTIQATYEWRGGHLFLEVRGSYTNFDEDGLEYVAEKQLSDAANLFSVSEQIELQRSTIPQIADASLYRRVKELKARNRWKPSNANFDAITADLLGASRPAGSRAIPVLKPQEASRTTRR